MKGNNFVFEIFREFLAMRCHADYSVTTCVVFLRHVLLQVEYFVACQHMVLQHKMSSDSERM